MTVQFETPYNLYEPGFLDYDFTWTCDDANEVVVAVGSVEQVQGDTYILVNFDTESGGTVRFFEAPTEQVEIRRRTPITQEVDYTEFTRFPAETHESQMDKDTRILQELFEGARSFDGAVNLRAVQNPETVVIENDNGLDATIQGWECQADQAGVFLGEVLESTEDLPADGSPTTKRDGYMWFKLAPIA